jgi:hypothetical protein
VTSGGFFSVNHVDLSPAIVANKVVDIKQTSSSAMLSGDCGCLM